MLSLMLQHAKMEKPIEPSKEDCCNSGCNPCIFDIYEKQLRLYEQYLENGKALDNNSQENGISQLEYTKFIVIKKVKVCDLHNLILFKRLTFNNNRVWWKPGHHFLYKYTSEVSCTRAYTPLITETEPRDNNYDFSIVVKKYDDGIVSPHLYNLSEGCVTLWRGPYGHFDIEPNKYQRIIMIAQGTGIAPFITIINHILKNENDMTKIVLLYSCKCINTIIFRDLLYSYKSYWNFKYEIYLSTVVTNSKIKYQEPIKQNRLSIEDLNNLIPFSNKDQILICGSQDFNKSYGESIQTEYPVIKNIVLF